MKKNYYSIGYKKTLLIKNKNFMEPAENFIRIFKMNFLNKKKLNCLDFGVGDGRHTKFLLKKKTQGISNRCIKNCNQFIKKKYKKI